MVDMTLCLGLCCDVRTKCIRYITKSDSPKQSFVATCKDKEHFMGISSTNKRKKKE
jgi:hypothetical protein